MQVSMHNWMRAEPIETTIRRLSKYGYDSIEISGEPEKYDTAQVRKLLTDNGLQCWGAVTLMLGDRDLLAKDEGQRARSVQYVNDCITMVKELAGQEITIVPSTVGKIKPEGDPDEEWQWAVESLKQCYDHGLKEGVKLALEPLNRFETYFLNRHDQALLLAKEVGPECGVCLDAFHINIEEANPYQAIRNVGGKMVDFHVADNNRMAPGQGSWDWGRLISTVKETGYDGAITVEFVAPIDRTPANPYKDALESGEVELTAEELKFIEDHGSSTLSDEFYGWLVSESIKTVRQHM